MADTEQEDPKAKANGTAEQHESDDAVADEPAHEIKTKQTALSDDITAKTAEPETSGDVEMADAQTPAADAAPVMEDKETDKPASNTAASSSAVSPAPLSPAAETDQNQAEAEDAKQTTSSEDKPDVDMDDAPAASGAAASDDQNAAKTQETSAFDAQPTAPAEDLNLGSASMSNLAIDATQEEPQSTADTSLSDAQPSSAKVARSREDDGEEEPAAKRLKTDPLSDAADLTPAPADNAMEVEGEVLQQTSLYRADGKPKTLDDPTLDGNIIDKYQSTKIRAVLAGIKKTKAGANFRAPVMQLWPALAKDYSLKVAEPIDIGTIEKRLKVNDDDNYPSYANLGDLKKDLQRLHGNAVKFNGADHFVAAQAKQVYEQIMERLSLIPAVEPAQEKKEAAKPHPSRHAEQRSSTHAPPAAASSTPSAPRRPSKPAVPAPAEKVAPSPAFAIPPNNNGVPLIRRDTNPKTGDNRPKRPVKPAQSKDLGYDIKKKKLSPELRFCNEVLTELMKPRHYEANVWFMQPVDTVALNIPTYYNIIKKPMDLGTMQEKLESGQYPNAKAFEADFWQIGKNCRKFNGEHSLVSAKVGELEDLFKAQWSKKEDWIAKHAPPERPAQQERPSPRPRRVVDSDDDEAESEEEADAQEPPSEALKLVESLQQRLKEENDKLNAQIMSNNPDLVQIQVSQAVVAALQQQVVQARQKLAEAPAAKKAANKPKAAQPKKAAAPPKKKVGSGLDASRNSTAGRKSGGTTKKATKQRHMGAIEKAVIGQAITEMEGHHQERAIDIIKKDSNQMENDSGELEIDIDSLSQEALVKLYDLSVKVFPDLRSEVERDQVAPVEEEPAPKPKASKPKKNKPMNKEEQEARLRHLSSLKAQIKGRNSGSQEPIESIEENGGGAAAEQAAPPAYQDSEDEESSEEE